MAIVFLQQRKIQKSLILIFIAVIIITTVVIWQGFFKEEITTPLPEVILLPYREIKIDYKVFENPMLKNLEPFNKIQPLKEKSGRENPFLPY